MMLIEFKIKAPNSFHLSNSKGVPFLWESLTAGRRFAAS